MKRLFTAGVVLVALVALVALMALVYVTPVKAQTPVTLCVQSETGSPPRTNCVPVDSTNPLPISIFTGCIGTPTVSALAEVSHVLKNAAGSLCGVYATNLTSLAGFLVVVNLAAVPGAGAITPLACVPLPPNGNASINFGAGAQSVYSTGIVVLLTAATTCFTYTTGITGFIAGQVL